MNPNATEARSVPGPEVWQAGRAGHPALRGSSAATPASGWEVKVKVKTTSQDVADQAQHIRNVVQAVTTAQEVGGGHAS